MSVKISGEKYAMMYGPTTGDKVRLADTSLVVEVEKDYTTYGDEVKFGGQKYRTEYPDDIHMQPHGQKRGICLLRKSENESLPVQDGHLCWQP